MQSGLSPARQPRECFRPTPLKAKGRHCGQEARSRGLFDRKRADTEAVHRVKALVTERFDQPNTKTLAVAELCCREAGCPTVVTARDADGRLRDWRSTKPLSEVAASDVERLEARSWQERRCDRRQEIFFIGSGIDWPALEAWLDAALLPAVVADGPETVPDLPAPSPIWQRSEAPA